MSTEDIGGCGDKAGYSPNTPVTEKKKAVNNEKNSIEGNLAAFFVGLLFLFFGLGSMFSLVKTPLDAVALLGGLALALIGGSILNKY